MMRPFEQSNKTSEESISKLTMCLTSIVGVLIVVPRGGFQKLGRLQRSKFLSRRIKYSNASCAFNPAVYMILCSGDVEINPGYVPECSTQT